MNIKPSFNDWLSSALPSALPATIIAFNFNIAETGDTYVVEVCGSHVFDPNNSDWACEETWTCRPSQFEISAKLFNNDWKIALSAIKECIENFMEKSESKNGTLHQAKAVAVGFVDGDLEYITGASQR